MPRKLVVDSSAIIALERAGLIKFLKKINYSVIIPKSVKEEINNNKTLKFLRMEEVKGRTLKLSKTLEYLGIGKGEAECCALAAKLKLDFVICDDRKFIRQKFFSYNKTMQNMGVLGFSFFLHIFYKKRLIRSVW